MQQAISEVDSLKPDSAFFYIDIDHFKAINASYGASLGDQLLIEITRRLNSLLGSEDMIGNFGVISFSFSYVISTLAVIRRRL